MQNGTKALVVALALGAAACGPDGPVQPTPDPDFSTVDDAQSFTGLAPSAAANMDRALSNPEPGEPSWSAVDVTIASATPFPTRAAFDAFCPVLALEDLEGPTAGGINGCSGPLDASGAGGCYPPGAIQPGITIASRNTPIMVSISPPVFGLPDVVAGPNAFADHTDVTFGPGVTGVGLDVHDVFGGSSWNVDFYSAGPTLEASIPIGPGPGGSVHFAGVFSPAPIVKVEINAAGGTAAELLNNIEFGACFIPVGVNIKPGSDNNSINTKNRGVIPVAILGSATFDVNTIDRSTLAFGPAGAAPAHKAGGHVEDVNGDGFDDLVSHYPTQDTGLAVGDASACVTGMTLGGQPIQGCDAVNIVK